MVRGKFGKTSKSLKIWKWLTNVKMLAVEKVAELIISYEVEEKLNEKL